MPPSRLHHKDWRFIYELAVDDRIPLRQLSRLFSISWGTMSARSRREKWFKHTSRQTRLPQLPLKS